MNELVITEVPGHDIGRRGGKLGYLAIWLHDDLLEQGESVCLNRVSRLTKLAGIKAQIGVEF